MNIHKDDFGLNEGQNDLLTKKNRWNDRIIVQEKLDGSNVGVILQNGELLAINRAGYLCQQSPWEQHQLFAHWFRLEEQQKRFRELLREGERVMGEWLAQAHGTIYTKIREPFVPFDIMAGTLRISYIGFDTRIRELGFKGPECIHYGNAISVKDALRLMPREGYLGATDGFEGIVYRCETDNKVNFLAKYVRPDKVDGKYLPNISNEDPIWNWRP
jgi:hypothetical protein